MKKMLYIFFVMSLLVISFGCVQESRVGDLTLLSTKNVSTLEGAEKMGEFEGQDCKSPFGGALPSQEEAIDRALAAGRGNVMVDAVIYFKPAACIFDKNCWTVKGTVLKTKDMMSKADVIDDNISVVYSDYDQETIGKKYLAFRKRSTVEFDHDTKHYDFIYQLN